MQKQVSLFTHVPPYLFPPYPSEKMSFLEWNAGYWRSTRYKNGADLNLQPTYSADSDSSTLQLLPGHLAFPIRHLLWPSPASEPCLLKLCLEILKADCITYSQHMTWTWAPCLFLAYTPENWKLFQTILLLLEGWVFFFFLNYGKYNIKLHHFQADSLVA
jgi:hypothetical protein